MNLLHLEFVQKGQFTGKHREQWAIVGFGGEERKGAYNTYSLIFPKTVHLSAVEDPLSPSPNSTSLACSTSSISFPHNISKSSSPNYIEQSCDHFLILSILSSPLSTTSEHFSE